MFRKEALVLYALAASVLLVVAGGSFWLERSMQQSAVMIAQDTLPSLVDAGTAIQRSEENWLRVHLLQHLTAHEKQQELVKQIKTYTTDDFWRDYHRSIYDPEDQANYDRMMAARDEFLRLRQDYFDLVLGDRLADADALPESKLTPAQAKYNAAAMKLFTTNARVGRERADNILRFARFMPWAVGVAAMLVFGLGVLTGLRGAFTGMDVAARIMQR